jgi:hypothetical protein
MDDDDDERDDTVQGKEETEERIYKGLSHIDINLDDNKTISLIDISSHQVDLDHIVCSQHGHLDHQQQRQRQRQQRSPIIVLSHPTISSTSN